MPLIYEASRAGAREGDPPVAGSASQKQTMYLLLDDLRPSNSFLNQENVERVRASRAPLVPVQVARVGNEWVLVEGHSRAYVAWERGQTGLEATEVKPVVKRERRLRHVSQLRILAAEDSGMQWGERFYMIDPRADI